MPTNTWTGATPGTYSTAARWSLAHVPTSTEDVVLDGTGTGQCAVDGSYVVASLNETSAHTGGLSFPLTTSAITVTTGNVIVEGAAVTGQGTILANGTGTISVNTTTPAVVSLTVGAGANYTGNAKISGAASAYRLIAGGAHTGLLTLQADASVADFSGSTKPNIEINTAASGSGLPSDFDYPSVRLIAASSKVSFPGIRKPNIDSLTSAASGATITPPSAGLTITTALSLNAMGTVWVLGGGTITMSGMADAVITSSGTPLDRVEAASGTLLLADNLTAEGLYIRSGVTLNCLVGKTITVTDPTDGVFLMEAGSDFELSTLPGVAINCRTFNVAGVSSGSLLHLDPTGAWSVTISPGGTGTATYTRFANCNAGTVGVDPPIMADATCEDGGGNQNVFFATVGSTGYARYPVPRSASGWTISGNNALLAAAASFPPVTTGTGLATYFGIGSAGTGAGELLFSGPVTPPIVIAPGATPVLPPVTTKVTEQSADAMGNAAATDAFKLIFTNVAWAAMNLPASDVAGSLYLSLYTANPTEAGSQTSNEITYQ